MKARAIFSGIIGGIVISVPLWLIVYYIWPSRLQRETSSSSWIEIVSYAIVISLILLTGFIASKWGWSTDREEFVISGGSSGLLIGCIAYTTIGAAAMGVMGNREILQSLQKVISGENEGVTYIIYAIASTARWTYWGFWAFIIIGFVCGSIGGILAYYYSPKGLGKIENSKGKWLYRLLAYNLVFGGYTGYIISSAVFDQLFSSVRSSIEKADFLSAILSSSTNIASFLVSMTILLLMTIPIATTLGWTIGKWKDRKNHFLSYLWLAICGLMVLCSIGSPTFDFGQYAIVLFITIAISVYAYQSSKKLQNHSQSTKHTIIDWLAYASAHGILGGTQLFAGIIPYALSTALIIIANIPHFMQNEAAEQTITSQTERLFSMTGSVGLFFILISVCIGLIIGIAVSLVRKHLFLPNYFDETPPKQHQENLLDGSFGMNDKKTSVFVSYSHADSTFVDRLVGDLRKGNIDVWIDKWAIRVGDSITDKVNEGIGSSDFLIIVLSTSSVNSKWVREEINTALIRNIEQGKQAYILPLLIEDCDLPPLLSHRRYANFKDDYTKGYLELVEAIEYRANNT